MRLLVDAGNTRIKWAIAERDAESWGKRAGSDLFYGLLRMGSSVHIPKHAGDFRWMDRKVVDALRRLPERNRFMKGLYAWVGFRSVALPFTPDARRGGESSFSLRSLATLALTSSETMSRKASPRIRPKDSTRARSSPQTPLGFSRSGTCQMRSSELCSSPNTVVAPMISTTMLIRPATRPLAGSSALLMSPCTAIAPSRPIRPCSCVTISPCTASRPKIAPATAMTITSSGASENIV